MPGPILIVLLAAATEELQAVLAGLVAAEAAAQREGAARNNQIERINITMMHLTYERVNLLRRHLCRT